MYDNHRRCDTKDAGREDAKQNPEASGNINRFVSTEFVQRPKPRAER